MDRADIRETISQIGKKYRWAFLVLALGFLLLSIPEKKETVQKSEPLEVYQEETLQQQLEILLSKLDGAGKVKVLLTIAAGEQSHYQMDEDISQTRDTMDRRRETVIIESLDRSEYGLVQRIDPPTYLGAVILCQGAHNASVKLAVVDAVSTATGLASNKISVLKMK